MILILNHVLIQCQNSPLPPSKITYFSLSFFLPKSVVKTSNNISLLVALFSMNDSMLLHSLTVLQSSPIPQISCYVHNTSISHLSSNFPWSYLFDLCCLLMSSNENTNSSPAVYLNLWLFKLLYLRSISVSLRMSIVHNIQPQWYSLQTRRLWK